MRRAFVCYENLNWDKLFLYFEVAYKFCTITTTEFTQFFSNYAQNRKSLPMDTPAYSNPSVNALTDRTRKATYAVIETIQKTNKAISKEANKKWKLRNF